MSLPAPRIVYITGWCRSGSTLIGNLLGEHPLAAHVGELSYLWANGVARTGTNSWCGCGADLARCPVWAPVVSRLCAAAGTPAPVLAGEMMDGHARYLRTRHTGARAAEAAGRRRRPAPLTALLARMAGCYQAVSEVAGASVVVDSSKFPAEAAALSGLAELDVLVLHLVRDPRATAYSWRRSKSYIPPMGAARSSGYWTAFNLASELAGRIRPERYLRVRYEDFARSPRPALAAIMRWAGLDGAIPVGEDGAAVLGVNHTVTGNPDRLRRGPIWVREDERWRDALPGAAAATAALAAWPLLPRYGYRITGWRAPRMPAPSGAVMGGRR